MAFDQKSMPKAQPPMNFSRAVEEPRMVPSPVGVRHVDNPTPISSPFYYPAVVTDSGMIGSGYGNLARGAAGGWHPRIPPPVGQAVTVNTSSGFVSHPNFSGRICAPLNGPSTEGVDESIPRKKLKFLVSFGGKILPRPSDGLLRYVGGQTRIIGVRRNVPFREFVQKLADIYRQNPVIKYELPDEDLDSLVSVSCPDDLENMMDECEKLLERSSDGSSKLRLFLFSVSELNPSGMLQFGDTQDSGQRYVDAVNGVIKGNGGGGGRIVRKESIASAASTQNSELSGNEAVDNLGSGQVDIAPSHSILSPQVNAAASNCNANERICEDLGKLNLLQSDQFSVGDRSNKSSNPSSAMQPECEMDIPLKAQGLDLGQSGLEVTSSASYLPSFAGDMYTLPQAEFPSAQFPASAGSVMMHQNPYYTASGDVPLDLFPLGDARIAPPSNIVHLHGNSIDPFFQPPRAQFVFRPEEYMAGPNIIRVPGHQNESAYQVHMPPGLGMLGGGYVLQQVPLQGHAVLYDELVPQTQTISPENNLKFDDCLMCQKALPHAHSDSAVQDQSNCSHVHDLSSVSSVPQTLDATRTWPASAITVNGTPSETTKGKQESEALAGILANNEHVAGLPVQSIGVMHENESALKKVNAEGPIVSVTVGRPTDIGTTSSSDSQFTKVGTAQVHTVPIHYKIKQDCVVAEPYSAGTSSIPTLDTCSQTEHAGYEFLNGYPVKFHAITEPGNTNFDISYGHHRPADSYIAGQKVRPDISVFSEQSKCPVDMLGREEYLEPKFAQGITGDMLLGDNFTNPRVVDTCQKKADNASSRPFTEATLCHGLRPADLNGAGRSLIPESPGVIALPPEWENNILSFQQNLPISDIENAPIGRTMPPPSQFPDIVDVHDSSNMFFGIQDPLNLHHDPRTLPPRPSKIPFRKEIFDPFGANHFANGESNLDAISENMATARVSREADAEFVRPAANGSAEDLIKQELQAVAESVAASVLQPSPPSHSQFPISEPDEPFYEGNQGNKARPPDKAHITFSVSDNRLQIIKNSDLEELRELGSGTFGTVYHGKWRGTDVAIKRINDRCFSGKASEQDRMRSDFWNEAIKLAELHHPNVVAFYGLVLDGPGDSVATVTEFMANGSLGNVLQKDKNLDKRKRLLIAMDVAFGMEYLHEKNIVHFDLKSDNLLVNFRDPHRPICKVSDLGLSKVKCQTLISGGVRGTLPWMAPELLNGSSNLVSEKVDVFSFGIVMWELLTGEEPYADLHYGAIIGGIVNNTLRPPVPESCDSEWRSLMEWCWSSEPSDRPTFTEAANHLRSMAAKVPSKPPSQQQHPSPLK